MIQGFRRGFSLAMDWTFVDAPDTPKNGALISGWIDSAATAILHRNEPFAFFSVISDRDRTIWPADWLSDNSIEFVGMIDAEWHIVHADWYSVFGTLRA